MGEFWHFQPPWTYAITGHIDWLLIKFSMLACIKQVLHEIVETGGSVFFFYAIQTIWNIFPQILSPWNMFIQCHLYLFKFYPGQNLRDSQGCCHHCVQVSHWGPISEHISYQETYNVFGQFCAFLGIVHCDLRPENVLCANKDSATPVKLCDFVLAKFCR